jgi:3-oxo-4,17-pregnadiene-20-carboxyl-CoA hydratase alpha subunit
VTEPPPTLSSFFERARDGKLTAIKCDGCGALAVPPRELCAECGQRRWSVVPLSGDGEIASFTVIRIAPRGHAGDAPYAIAAVRLVEGVSLLGRVVDIPFDELAIGRKVRFRPLRIHDVTALGFGPF